MQPVRRALRQLPSRATSAPAMRADRDPDRDPVNSCEPSWFHSTHGVPVHRTRRRGTLEGGVADCTGGPSAGAATSVAGRALSERTRRVRRRRARALAPRLAHESANGLALPRLSAGARLRSRLGRGTRARGRRGEPRRDPWNVASTPRPNRGPLASLRGPLHLPRGAVRRSQPIRSRRRVPCRPLRAPRRLFAPALPACSDAS